MPSPSPWMFSTCYHRLYSTSPDVQDEIPLSPMCLFVVLYYQFKNWHSLFDSFALTFSGPDNNSSDLEAPTTGHKEERKMISVWNMTSKNACSDQLSCSCACAVASIATTRLSSAV